MKKRLKELFKYENGLLIRIVKTSNNTKVGDVVGTSTDTSGYAIVKIDGATQRVHRMIWIYHNGAIEDKYIIDHKDRNKANNCLSNLEYVSHKENVRRYNSKKVKWGDKEYNSLTEVALIVGEKTTGGISYRIKKGYKLRGMKIEYI